MRRLGLPLLLGLVALAGSAPSASAHAMLERTVPARGSVVAQPPRQVAFFFDEHVEAAFGAVRVYDARGREVQAGRIVRPGGAASVGVRLPGRLPRGTYTATYRVVSADGHPVSGGVVFSVGAPGAASGTPVADLLDRAGTGPVTGAAYGVVKGVAYLAIALGVGGLAFLALCWLPALRAVAGPGDGWRAASEAFARRLARVLAAAAGLGLVAGVLAVVLQATVASGGTFWAALRPSVVREVLGTRVGGVLGLRVLAWAALAVLLAAPALRRDALPTLRPVALGADGLALARPRAAWALAVPAAVLLLTPAFAGHASAGSPAGVLVPADVLHVVAMSAWLGGLAVLLAVVPAATRRLEPGDRSRLLAALLLRFSPLALGCVVVLVASGVAQAAIHLDWSLSPLLHSAFGRAVAIKVALLVVLTAVAAVNRRRVVPALRALAGTGASPGATGRLLRTTLRAEVALVVAVLGVTAALVGYPPPVAGATGPVTVEAAIGPQRLQLTADPATAGVNEVHLYLLDARTGAPAGGTKELRVTASLPARGIGPLPIRVRPAGPGHFLADAAQLAPAGAWRLTVVNRVSEFDEFAAKVRVPIR